MKKMQLLLTAALMLSLSSFAIAGTPKGDTKTDIASEATAGSQLYWYKVVYDAANPNGYIPAGAALIAHAEKESVPQECETGDTRDCLRGFNSAQTSATSSAGIEQITTDEEP